MTGLDGETGSRVGRGVRQEREPEDTALAVDPSALGGELATHELRQPAADGKAKARPAVPPRDGRIRLAERLEEPLHAVGADADAGVADLDLEPPTVGTAPCPPQGRAGERQLGFAALGELHRVGEEVDEDLAQPALVADDRARQRCIRRIQELDPLCRRRGGEHVDGAFDAGGKGERLVLQLDLARLDLREVEDVVDDRQECITGRPDDLGVVALLLVQGCVQQQPAHPDDRVHRRADLMAHGGQEGALGLVRVLGRLARRLRLAEQSRVVDGDGGLLGETDEQVEVALGEQLARHRPPHGHPADDLVVSDERRDHQPVRLVGVGVRDQEHPRIGRRVVDRLGPSRGERATDDPVSKVDRGGEQLVRDVAERDDRAERVAAGLGQEDGARIGGQQAHRVLDDPIEHDGRVEGRRDLAPDVHEGRHLDRMALGVAEEPRVLDGRPDARRDRRRAVAGRRPRSVPRPACSGH